MKHRSFILGLSVVLALALSAWGAAEGAASTASTSGGNVSLPLEVSIAGENLPDHDTFIADETEPQVHILVTSKKGVRDLKVLALSCENIDENGKPSFSVQELHSQPELTPERPLVVVLTFYGTLPSYGVSCTDKNGKTRSFGIGDSGLDGSPYLIEF